jgi:group I intron endonuclease
MGVEIYPHNFIKKMGFIYKITSPTGRLYVGKTYNFKQRVSDYRCMRYRSKRSIIIWSIKKYGWDTHKMEIVEEVDDKSLNEREIFWIEQLQTYTYNHHNGMNLTKGGDGQRHSWKNDLERVRVAKLRCGENAPSFGKKVSPEIRQKISKSVSVFNRTHGKKPSEFCHFKSRGVRLKQVICYKLTGEFVGEYKSLKEAADDLCINRRTANDALNEKQAHAHGIIFKHKSDGYPNKIDTDGINFFVRKMCEKAA